MDANEQLIMEEYEPTATELRTEIAILVNQLKKDDEENKGLNSRQICKDICELEHTYWALYGNW